MRWELLIFLTERGLTAMRNGKFAAHSAGQNRALVCPSGYFAPCGCVAFEAEYAIYDKNIHRKFLLYTKARDG